MQAALSGLYDFENVQVHKVVRENWCGQHKGRIRYEEEGADLIKMHYMNV